MTVIFTAVLSGSGCLIMIFLITITLVLTVFSVKRCFNNNQQKFNMDCNDAYTRRTLSRSAHQEVGKDYDIVDTDSEVNVACRSSDKVPSAIGATIEHSSSQEYEDKLVQNVAYVDKQSVIPVSSNAAYTSHQQTAFQEDDVDQYAYI